MFPFTANEMMLIMCVGLLVMGMISMLSGILVLVFRVSGKDVHTIASQTVRLAQKGVADDVSGLVGNASALLDAVNQLVRTTTGVGVFLILVSFVLYVASFLLINWVMPV
jgi:hypothetical protein